MARHVESAPGGRPSEPRPEPSSEPLVPGREAGRGGHRQDVPTTAAPSGIPPSSARRAARGPTRAELLAAYGRTVPDLVGPDLRVLLVGINPSLFAGATGVHFGRPANRLWPTLYAAGFTRWKLHPSETDELLRCGLGIASLVARATARADELTDDELRAGVGPLTELVERWRPAWVAFLGLSAYRTAFGRRKAVVGRQPETLGPAGIWLLPNPSGLNAHYQLADLARAYGELRAAAYPGAGPAGGSGGSAAVHPPGDDRPAPA